MAPCPPAQEDLGHRSGDLGPAQIDLGQQVDSAAQPDGGPVVDQPRPLILVAIDSFDPRYLRLNRNGEDCPDCTIGNDCARAEESDDRVWLMCHLHRFIEQGVLFPQARDFLPSATDMNHLNVLAGTSSAQTGIVGVSTQVQTFSPDTREPLYLKPHLDWTADEEGCPTTTLFHFWKERWPQSATAIISGKGWVAEMYRGTHVVDHIVTGQSHPREVPDVADLATYMPHEPPTDRLPECDPESVLQQAFMTLLDQNTSLFPPDVWTVAAAREILTRHRPGLTWILLGQSDDVQHGLGAAWDPGEFEPLPLRDRYVPPPGCRLEGGQDWPERWQLVSRRNPHVFKEPILDALSDVDERFEELMQAVHSLDEYRDAIVVAYSDHGAVTHTVERRVGPGVFRPCADAAQLLEGGGLISAEQRQGVGFAILALSSMGMAYYMGDQEDDGAEAEAWAQQAKEYLLSADGCRCTHPETGEAVCPWWILTRQEMIDGFPDGLEPGNEETVVLPGELWHERFGRGTRFSDFLLWPNLFFLMKDGWQIAVFDGTVANLGLELPAWLPPTTPLIGGHGSVDASRVLFAFQGSGLARGKRVEEPGQSYRLADIGVTLARHYGFAMGVKLPGTDGTCVAGETNSVVGVDRWDALQP